MVKFPSFREIRNQIKWAWQRVFRGWDDRVIWNLDIYLAENIPVWLDETRAIKGCPLIMVPEGKDTSEYTDEDWETVQDAWNKEVDTMIEGFRAAVDLIDGNNTSWNKFLEEYDKRYGDWDMHNLEQSNNLMQELGTWDGIKAEEAELMIKFNTGMDIFKKYYFHLWT